MKTVSYLLGDINPKLSQINADENSFRPSFQHVFEENFPINILKIKISNEGREEYKFFDMSSRRFLTSTEVDIILNNKGNIIE